MDVSKLTSENIKRANTLGQKDTRGSGGLHILTIGEVANIKVYAVCVTAIVACLSADGLCCPKSLHANKQ